MRVLSLAFLCVYAVTDFVNAKKFDLRCEPHFYVIPNSISDILLSNRWNGLCKENRLCLGDNISNESLFSLFLLQVICTECISTTHRNHLSEPISRVAKSHLSSLRQAADRAKTVVEQSAVASSKLLAASKKIEAHCNKLQSEVVKFNEDYIKAVEEHKMNLLEQIKQVK